MRQRETEDCEENGRASDEAYGTRVHFRVELVGHLTEKSLGPVSSTAFHCSRASPVLPALISARSSIEQENGGISRNGHLETRERERKKAISGTRYLPASLAYDRGPCEGRSPLYKARAQYRRAIFGAQENPHRPLLFFLSRTIHQTRPVDLLPLIGGVIARFVSVRALLLRRFCAPSDGRSGEASARVRDVLDFEFSSSFF